jgi:ketosteroid isomerase-like protein
LRIFFPMSTKRGRTSLGALTKSSAGEATTWCWLFANKARGETSGAPFEVPTFHVWSFRDGRPWRGSAYESRDEALEAAGLPE